ncbi:MAG: DUF4296 domain-containing protein [Crocinitomicaceae bacterium]
MRVQRFCIFLVLLFIYSCQQKESVNAKLTDENIISKELMISVFEELVLIESHLQAKYYSYANYGQALQLSRDSLLKSKGMTFKQFTNSFDYYSKSDEDLVTLYQDVLNDYNEKSAKSVVRKN